MMAEREHRTAGVTMVELLITVVIGLVILGLTFTIVMANRNLMSRDQLNTELNQNLRIGADILGDDIRIAGQGILSPRSGNMPLTIQNDQIVVRNRYLDDSTGVTIESVEELTYRLSGEVLERQRRISVGGAPFVARAPQGVINKVRSMQVWAVDQSGNRSPTLATPSDWNTLRAVEVQLIGEADLRGETHTSELTSSFFPRNVLSR